MRSFNKRTAAVLTAGALIAGTGVAYAYWTTNGTGTGSATVGTDSDNLTITASLPSGGADLIPGGDAVPLQLSVVNPEPYTASLGGLTLYVVPGTVKCDATTVSDTWFSLSDSSIADNAATQAIAGDTTTAISATDANVAISMNNSTANQDGCKEATVSFDLTTTAPPAP